MVYTISIDYQRNKSIDWVPSDWSIEIVARHGDTDQFTECTVQKYTFNEVFPPETFRLKFPAGTLVYDRSQREYFVRKDGSLRRLIRGRGKFDYQQLLREDTTQSEPAK